MDSTKQTTELLPCPCCEAKAQTGFENGFEFSVWHYVECTKCGLRTDRNTDDKEQAIAAWNTRAATQEHPPADVERALKAYESALKYGKEVAYGADEHGNTVIGIRMDIDKRQVEAIRVALKRSAENERLRTALRMAREVIRYSNLSDATAVMREIDQALEAAPQPIETN